MVCGIGEHSPTGLDPCFPCPVDTYADDHGLTECIPCPPGTTTEVAGGEGIGSWDALDCRGKS